MRPAASVLRFLLGAVAIGIACVAFAMNAAFWLQQMESSGPLAQVLWSAFSVSAGVFKFGIPALLTAYGLRWRDRKGLVAVFLIALCWDVWSGVGYAALTRGAATSEAGDTARRRGQLESDLKTLREKLATVAQELRTTAVIEAELAAAKRVAPNCQYRANARGEACRAVADLEEALAKAQSRTDLEAQISAAQEKLHGLPGVKDAQPDISTVGNFLRGLNIPISDQHLGYVRVLLVMLLLELAPPVLLVFVMAPPAERITLPGSRRGAAAPISPALAGAGQAPRRAPAPRATAADVLELLRLAQADAAGWVDSTQRAMADELGISAAEVNRQLKELEAKRVVEVDASRRGTRVKLLTPAAAVVNLQPRG